MKNKKIMRWFYPGVALFIITTFLIALLIDFVPNTMDVFLSTTMGMISFAIMLTLLLIAVRPKQIEKVLGLTEMYEVHAWMAMALPITLFIHVFIRWSGLEKIVTLDISDASIWGYIGLITLFLVMVTGIFVLSDTIIQFSDKLIDWKENVFKRNRHLWIHRLAIISVLAIHFHVYNVYYLSDNVPFRFLATTYTVLTIGWYFYYKIKIARLPKYEVIENTMPTPDIYRIRIKSTNGEIFKYRPGQYGFFRFVESEIPSEAHPFSFSSAPQHTQDTLEIMIKESGDWTSELDVVKAGDKVTIEGPYGNFYPEEEEKSDKPMVLLSGGIGVTPNFSILRHEMIKNSDRRIAFVWGLDIEDDMMYIDKLEKMAEENENFTFHLVFSGEEVEGYPHGFIDDDFIRNEGLEEYYETANWHVCGPPPMLEAAKGLLSEQNVSKNRQYIEEFAF